MSIAPVTLTRLFRAPRALVWSAWTDPKRVAAWWGPRDFAAPRCEWDARPGGAIHIDMRAPDGTIYPMSGVFHEVRSPERLVFTFAWDRDDGQSGHDTVVTITFAEQRGRTTMTFMAAVPSVGFTWGSEGCWAG